jgi:hypothetical protein
MVMTGSILLRNTSSVQITIRFGFIRYITFTIYLDIVFI